MQTVTKFYPFELKSADPDEGTFEGYASAYGVVDSDGEVVDRGAFAKTIKEGADRVKIYYNHGWLWNEAPIGKALALTDDDKGLLIRARIAPTVRGTETLTLAREGVITELSIGARVVKAQRGSDGRRHFKELALREVSLVDNAANPEARILEVKSERLIAALRDLTPDDVNPDALKAAIESLKALLPTEPDESTPVGDAAASVKADEPVIDHSALAEVLRDFTSLSAQIRSLI
jgi:HK97 family phage prohead protease